jgi:hypothetical protein
MFKYPLLVLLLALSSIPTEATLIESNKFNGESLQQVSQAIRRKKIALFWVKVYRCELLASLPGQYLKTSAEAALNSLTSNKLVALRMEFLRDVGVEKMVSSFTDGLKENDLKPEEPVYQHFFDAMKKSGDVKEKQTWTIVFEKKDKDESIHMENGEGKVQMISVPQGTTKNIFKIWFGKPADSGLEEMKEAFLK